MGEWKTIETAPKDGSPVLMWLGSPIDRNYLVQDMCPNIAIGFWIHQRWQSIEVDDAGSMGGEETGWMEDWCCLDIKPTHWMPLPTPPIIDVTSDTLDAQDKQDQQVKAK